MSALFNTIQSLVNSATATNDKAVFTDGKLFRWYKVPVSICIDGVQVEATFEIAIYNNGGYSVVTKDDATINGTQFRLWASNIGEEHEWQFTLYEAVPVGEDRTIDLEFSKSLGDINVIEIIGHISGAVTDGRCYAKFDGTIANEHVDAYAIISTDTTLTVKAADDKKETIALLKMLVEQLAPYETSLC